MFGKNYLCFRAKNEEKSNKSSLILEAQDDKGCLYLGDFMAARNKAVIKLKNIKCVLTVASYIDISYDDPTVQHKTYEIDDADSVDISSLFEDTYRLISNGLKKGSVLVHCAAGISRSATIVIAYLMKRNNWSYNEAYEYVKKRRKIINPNSGFVKQLKELEKSLK